MQKIINYKGEKFILSEETAKHFNDDFKITSILKIPNSDNYQIEMSNGNSIYFGMCKKYKFNVCDIFDNMPVVEEQEEIEKMILDKLSEAYNLFIELEQQYLDEIETFKKGIQQCEYIIGIRYARKYRPDLFIEKKN